MSDLVKKLRDNETSTCGPHAKQLMNKAADEIERLRAALRDIRDTTANQCTLEQWHKKALAALEGDDE